MVAVQGDARSAIFSSEIASSYDVHNRLVHSTLRQKYGVQNKTYTNMVLDLGFDQFVSQDKIEHFEDLPYYANVKVRANVAAVGAGNNITFALHADSEPSAGGNPFVREGDVLMLNKTENTGRVESVTFNGTTSVWEVVLKPSLATTNFALTAGDTWAITSGVWKEGSLQPSPAFTGVVAYDAYLQITKETLGMTGTELTNSLWFDMTEKGAATKTYWSPVYMQAEYRLDMKREGAALFSEGTTNTNMDETQTKGLFPVMKSTRGYTHPTGGAMVNADIDDLNSYWDGVYGSQYYIGLGSAKRARELDAELVQDMQNTMIQQAKEKISKVLFGGTNNDNQQAFEVNYVFNAVNRGGRNFTWSTLMTLNDTTRFNTSQSLTNDYMACFPAEKTADAKKVARNHISILKKRHDGYNRWHEVWQDGAGHSGLKIGQIDAKYVYMRTHFGMQHFKMEQTSLVIN